MSNNTKPVLLFAAQRAGSKNLDKMLGKALADRGITHLDHPLALNKYTTKEGKSPPSLKEIPRKAVLNYAQERKKTWEILYKNRHKLFYKLHLTDIFVDNVENLILDYDWVVCYRENIFEQYISFLISQMYNNWLRTPDWHPKKKRVLYADFKSFVDEMMMFQYLRKQLNVVSEISTESIAKRDFESIGRWDNAIFTKLLSIEFIEEKKNSHEFNLSLIKNINDCIMWYRNSFLQDLYEI